MRTFLILCAVIATALACPCNKPCLVGKRLNYCSHTKKILPGCTKSLLPAPLGPPSPICPSSWKVKTFDSQYSTEAFQGTWYLNMATPICIKGLTPIKTGLFSNIYPCSNVRVLFKDTTPDCKFDFNTDYTMLDSSFNLATQRLEVTKTLFKAAYGSTSPLAIFNVCTEAYYETDVVETEPATDDALIKHEIVGNYKREYTLAVIGCDNLWQDYMVFAVANIYDNCFGEPGTNFVWVFTRKANPDWSTYQKAFKDIVDSNLNPHTMVSMDQSIELTKVPTVTAEEIDGVTQSTVTKSSKYESSSTVDGECESTSTNSSSSSYTTSSSTTVETKSTVEFTLDTNYKIQYKFGTYDLFGKYNILMDLTPETIREALSGQYFVNYATPYTYGDYPDARVGILNTAFPACSLQVLFDTSVTTPWDYKSPCAMLDRGYNIIEGKSQQTRSVITSSFDGSHPYGVFTVYTEGYYGKTTIKEVSPLTVDGMICTKPSPLYSQQYVVSIAGYDKDNFLILMIANKYENSFYPEDTKNQFYVMTRKRLLSQECIKTINQDVLRIGYNLRGLISIDQTKTITETFKFDDSYFQITKSSLTVTKTDGSTTVTKSLSSTSTRSLSPSIPIPSIVPTSWKVKMFEDQCATQAIQGIWYIQLASPICINDLVPLKTGLFNTLYPSCNNRIIFKDTTPDCPFDYNTDYIMLDSSFNLATQCLETTQTLFKSAFGKDSPYAIFNVGTDAYYPSSIKDLSPLTDDQLIKHKIEGDCKREYTLAVIGADEKWQKYMVFATVNTYNNTYKGNDNHLLWVLTREICPDWDVYKCAYKDIKKSGMCPYSLVSVDQSIDLTKIKTVTAEEIAGVVKTSVTKSSTSESSSTVDEDYESSSVTTSSSTTVTTEETTSTVEFTLDTTYKIQYQFGTYELFGEYKILKDLQAETIREALSGQYFINYATPYTYGDYPDARVGILNTAFPACSLQVLFDTTVTTPWDYKSPCAMLDRGYNMIEGKTQQTRSVITSSFDGCHPYGVFTVYTEGYYGKTKIEEVSPLTVDGMICTKPSPLYSQQYIVSIAGYDKDNFLILTIANKYKNSFCPKDSTSQFYVLTRERLLTSECITKINQDILRIGYKPNYLISIDQTKVITDTFKFDDSYFQITKSSLTVTKIDGSTTVTKSLSSTSTRSLSPSIPIPSIVPSSWNVKKFEDQCATQAIQGVWYLQLASLICIDNLVPLKTGLFNTLYPSCNNRIIFKDTTPDCPFDYNTDYIMLDSSFNLATQSLETTQTLFKSAFGKNSPYTIFNVGTEQYYPSSIKELSPLTDDQLIKHKIEGDCKREYTLAVIGADEKWQKYMVFATVNTYNNTYTGNDNHLIWLFTREICPDWDVYKCAYEDIKKSGMCPYSLVSVDQSIDLTKIKTVTAEEIAGVVKTSVTKSSTSESSSTVDEDYESSSVTTSSSTTVTTEETTSTVEFTLDTTYKIQYQFGTYELFGEYKILKDLQAETIREALSGQYFINYATPYTYGDYPDARVGILNTAFPACSLQVLFDTTVTTPWDYKSPCAMLDRGYNMIEGKTQQTRSVITSSFDGSHPYGVFTVYTEGYYGKTKIEEVSPLTVDGMICTKPSPLYSQQYIVSIAGYDKDNFLILTIANKYKNSFCPKDSTSQFYVLTRERLLTSECITKINQDILRIGYKPNYLISIDQTKVITDTFKFDDSYFQITKSSLTVTKTDGSTTVTKSLSSTSTRSLSTSISIPSIIPSSWNVKKFEDQCATQAIQGVWYIQLASPICIDNLVPLKTGLFNTLYPSCNNRIIFKDTTPDCPFDYNTDYIMLDSSFNLATQCLETTQTLFKSAFGKDSPYAIFNVGTDAYYSSSIKELSPLTDDQLIKHKIEGDCKREYTLAVIGADEKWQKYMVFATVNTYNNKYHGNDNHLLWVLTREKCPDWDVYQHAYKDIKDSKLSPSGLVSIDQSIDLTKVSTVTAEDIDGVVKSSVTKSSSSSSTSESSSNFDSDYESSSVTTSSSTTSTTVETKSTVEFTLDTSYTIQYEYGTYELFGKYKILKDLKPEVIRQALSGQYFVNYATPFSFKDLPDARVGILNTAFPACSLQVLFDDSVKTPWDYKSPCMMLDRGYNMILGQTQQTRSVVYSSFDGSTPYGVFTVYTEGYYGKTVIPEISPLTVDGMICTKPGPIYTQQYVISIAGYDVDNFLIISIANKFENSFCPKAPESQFYVLTRKRLLTSECITKINQDILRIGYCPSYMISIDQTKTLKEEFKFETSYFEITETSSSVTIEESSSSSTVSSSSSVVEESSSSSSGSEIEITIEAS